MYTPVSRAFCSSPYHKGQRWLLACYFYRHPRHKTGLQSYCITCQKIRMRAENVSEKQLRKRHERNREYKAARRREAGVPVRNLHNPNGNYGEGRALRETGLFLDRQKLLRYLDKYLTVETVKGAGGGKKILNGKQLSETDARYIRNLRSGELERANYDRVDKLAAKYKLPMWEIERLCLTQDDMR